MVRMVQFRSRVASSIVTPRGRSIIWSSRHCLDSWSPPGIGPAMPVIGGGRLRLGVAALKTRRPSAFRRCSPMGPPDQLLRTLVL